MKKFLLVLFGDFRSRELSEEVALSLTPIVDSPHLKFNFMDGSLIFHFASEVDMDELSSFIETILFDITTTFILTEVSDKLSINFPEEIKNHLLDLENHNDNIEMRLNVNREINDEDDDSYVALLLNDIKRRVPKPSLDQILEKIKSKGILSLSQYEKDILDEYSK